jgi:hypothetical protein
MNHLESELRNLRTLDEALSWAFAREPKVVPLETIPQDEYTHDVVFQCGEREFIAFDAT